MTQHFELRTDPAGDIYLKMDSIRGIGLQNIADLASHNLSRVGNRLMHIVEFANGGNLEVTLLIIAPGIAKVEVFRGHKIALRRIGDDLIVGQMT